MGSVYRLAGQDFSQFGRDTVTAYLSRWEQTWAAAGAPRVRLVFRAVPLDLRDPIHRSRKREADARDEATTRHLRQYAGLLEKAAKGRLMGVEHYLVLPTLEGDEARMEAQAMAAGFGMRCEAVADLPPLVQTRYRVQEKMLVPEAGNYPLLSVLVSYDLTGKWDWAVLARLLCLGFPLDLSIEVVTHTGGEAFGKLDRMHDLLDGLAKQVGTKAALQKMAADHQHLLSEIQRGDALHQVGLAVLLQGKTQEELRERERAVGAETAGRVALRRLDSKTGELFRAFFTSHDRPKPPERFLHNVASTGAAILSGPLGTQRRSDRDGVMWGISGQMPFFWEGFGPELKEPNHIVVLGTTGSGKTVSVSAVLLREMNLMGSQVVMLDPMGNCRRLVGAVGPQRASYNPLSLRSLRINPLEMLNDELAEQVSHLTVVVGLLLGRPLNERERAAVSAACTMLYEGVTPETPAVNQPRLEDLTRALRGMGGDPWLREAADYLGGLLDQMYVRGAGAGNFNVPTQSDWRLESDLVAFDFAGVPEEDWMRRLCYYLVLSTLKREAYRQKRSRRRIIAIDEFRVMSTEPALARRVAEMYKTFRTLGVGVWALEQDILTFTGLDRGGGDIDTTAGFYILANATMTVVMAQRAVAAPLLQAQYPHMTEDHLRHLTALNPQRNDGDKGRGLVVLPGEVYPIRFDLTSHELACLAGS